MPALAWDVVDTLFRDHRSALVKHHLDSYDVFVLQQFPRIMEQYNPVYVYNSYNEVHKKYETEVKLYFSNVTYDKPTIHENNGSTKPMTPAVARLRNLTYSSAIHLDIHLEVTTLSGDDLEVKKVQERKIAHVNIGKMPVMLMSTLCVLRDRTHVPLSLQGECTYEQGGYFIINGSEKVIIAQERQAENKMYCFKNTRSTKYSHIVEVRSVSRDRIASPKTLNVKITSKEGLFGKRLYIGCTKFKQDLPLCIVFRALGVEADRDIVERIVYDVEDPVKGPLLQLLQSSLEESSTILTQHCALEYMAKTLQINNQAKEMRIDDDKRIKMVNDALLYELTPHLGKDLFTKAYFLGAMVRKLLLFYMGYIKEDDRDSYCKKRVDSSGVLLSNLSRQYATKMIKEIRTGLNKEMNTGNWKYTKDVKDLLNPTNIYKVVKTATLESGLKYALATGTWGMKNMLKSRSTYTIGVAHVLNRLSYLSTLSHLRRINTPIDKTSKLIQPRKLHATQWGYMCPCETPEGASIGVVKNLSMLATITSDIDCSEVLEVLHEHEAVDPFDEAHITPAKLHEGVLIHVNGQYAGVTCQPYVVVDHIRQLRRKGIVHPHTSVGFQVARKEIYIHTESGRVVRALLILDKGKHRCTPRTLERLRDRSITWNELLMGYDDADGTYHPSVLEYVDPQEAELSRVEMAFSLEGGMNPKATHCEVHPSLILGVVAATICFPDHNQSPRNTYQSAMGKQAMGIYCTNFHKRLDSMGNILNYSMVPMVQTRVGRLIHQDKMPNGNNAFVAIMSYSGFNQEDSVLINRNAVDRGFYHSTFYRTYKDEERKNQVTGEEEKFGAPDAALTRGLKPGSYQGLKQSGFVRTNVNLKGGDVIIGKTVPLRGGGHGDGVAMAKPFHDQSTTLRHNESGVSDYVFESRNGEGYRFAKVRVRSTRIPGIGDKFSSCHGQKGTVGMVFDQEDMPFVARTGQAPDMIINPHCIPSRMTMGQLYESILGKCGVRLGVRGDGTAFNGMAYEDVCELLERCGMERHGNEVLVHGQTGERIPCAVFMGPIYEQRLKHMVEDKIHSRSTGPKLMLTRQPAEGRARDGGLRIGEMERDCMIAHGAGSFLKERMLDMSDRYAMHVGRTSGLTSAVNDEENICQTFAEDRCDMDVAALRVPYGWKLLSQELQAMAIAPRLETKS